MSLRNLFNKVLLKKRVEDMTLKELASFRYCLINPEQGYKTFYNLQTNEYEVVKVKPSESKYEYRKAA